MVAWAVIKLALKRQDGKYKQREKALTRDWL